MLEAALLKPDGKLPGLQICCYKGQVCRHWQPALLKPCHGPSKRCRVIDIENLHVAGKWWLSPRKGIESSTDDHVLPDAAGSRLSQPVLGKSVPESKQTAKQRRQRGAMLVGRSEDCIFGGFRNKPNGNWVFENSG